MQFFRTKRARPDRRNLVIFGAGAYGATAYLSLAAQDSIVAFIDNDQSRQGSMIYGIPILAPEDLKRLAFDAVVIASDYREEIHQQLVDALGISQARIETFVEVPRATLRAVLRDGLFSVLCSVPQPVGCLLLRLLAGMSRDFRDLAIAPIAWLDTSPSPQREILRPSRATTNAGPRYVERPQAFSKISIPAQTIDVFENAIISTASSGFLVGDTLVVERVPCARLGVADLRSGQIIQHSSRAAVVRSGHAGEIPRGIAIVAYNATNYYHIVIETLSKLASLDAVPPALADAPLLMPVSFSRIRSVRRLVECLAPGREVVWLDNNRQYRVGRMVWISSPNLLVTNLRAGLRYTPAECFVRPESITYLRSVLNQPSFASAREAATPRRIYLARKNYLRSYNQDELLPLACARGFTPVYLEDLAVEEQAALFYNADWIIGPTGAAWTNLIFAQAGTRALSWMAKEHGDVSCYSVLAETVGVQLDYLSYCVGVEDTRQLYFMPYRLQSEQLTAWLDRIG